MSDASRTPKSHEYLWLLGFLLICIAGIVTVLLPETRNEDEPQVKPASQSAPEASAPNPRP